MPSKFGGIPVDQPVSQFGGIPVSAAPQPEVTSEPRPISSDTDTDVGGLGDKLASFVEPALTVASGVIAEPLAGLAGLAAAPVAAGARALGIDAPLTGADVVGATREALTYQPKTEAGQAGLQAVGETLAPVGEAFSAAENYLGDAAFEATGSPALAAAAKTIPTAIGEILGMATAKGAVKAVQWAKKAKVGKYVAREISEATPSIDQLKDASRAVYQEIDEMGVAINPESYNRLVRDISADLNKLGLDKTITPDASRALKRLQESTGREVSLSEIDTLRQVAQGAAGSIKPKDAALGASIIDSIDSFLDTADPNNFSRAAEAGADIGQRYKVARDLWGRARRSELIGEAFEKAKNQASGFENGIRTQFRGIINNKKQRRFFKPAEISAMKRVVRGTKGENIAKLIGRLGFSEGGATNILGGAAGATLGGVVAGAPGAVIVPVIGQVSRKLAQRLTVKNAEFADQVIRAGVNAKRITNAYMKNTPKAQRSAQELSELLMDPGVDFKGMSKSDDLVKQAIDIAKRNQAALVASTLPQGLPEEE